MADFRSHFLNKVFSVDNPNSMSYTLISYKLKVIVQNKEKGSKKTSCKVAQYKFNKNMGSIFYTFEYLALFVIRAEALKTHH